MATNYKLLVEDEGLKRGLVPGETLMFKVNGDDTDGVLDDLVLDVLPKVGPPLHIHHTRHETVHFLKGRARKSFIRARRY